ncbi:MAG: hypothetical protein IPI07_08480 [Flavobacteriales bacterium]|jgi:cell division protein FtsQ|nr:hypothetical protein [Flavobacteriales bacterium]MBK9074129.1 hypothetical protein [Flavobacteriales bacterium]
MKNPRKLLRPVLMAAVAVLLVGALGFVERTADRRPVQDLAIEVRGMDGAHFITEQQVREEVLNMGGAVIGVPLAEMDIRAIEDHLRAIPCVSRAEAYHTLDGVLHVRVDQRAPVVRVFDRDGTTYYIDAEGHTMPLSSAHTPRVPVALGELHMPGASTTVLNVTDGDSLMRLSRLNEVFRIASFIRADPFRDALIDQIVATPDGEFELIPRVGAQRVRIGDGTALEERFAKLRLFYAEGIKQTDWRRYSTIDLRFDAQVVCTQRTTP